MDRVGGSDQEGVVLTLVAFVWVFVALGAAAAEGMNGVT
jgi:hypothetical protein